MRSGIDLLGKQTLCQLSYSRSGGAHSSIGLSRVNGEAITWLRGASCGSPTSSVQGAGFRDRVEHVAAALRLHNIEAIVVDTGEDARTVVLGLIPEGAQVHSGKSKTLEDVGLYSELVESGRYDAIRPRIFKMDRQTQGRG